MIPSPKHETKRLVATLSTRSRSQCKRLDLVELVGYGIQAIQKKDGTNQKNISLKSCKLFIYHLIRLNETKTT